MVAAKHAGAGYFLRRIPEHLTDPRKRQSLDADLQRVDIGFSVWRDQRDSLQLWAITGTAGSMSTSDVENWWFGANVNMHLDFDQRDRLDQFPGLVSFRPEHELVIQEHLAERNIWQTILIIHLHKDLKWLDELSQLRDLALKTWPADQHDRHLWTGVDLSFAREYYADQQPILEADNPDEAEIDPFTLHPVSYEQGLGWGLDGLGYCMSVIMRAAVIDFVDEVLEHNRFLQARGSLRCLDCGRFVARNVRGHGQLYCSKACKKRAAKRRYRKCGKSLAAVHMLRREAV
jgi:hypothetical protein